MTQLHRDYVWECDYGEHTLVTRALKILLASQNAYQLGLCSLFANNNPYNLELYVIFGYEEPLEGQIEVMKNAMLACGARYRPDLTMGDLLAEMAYKRFQSATAAGPDSIDMLIPTLFFFKDRAEIASVISMRPLGKKLPVFLSHSSNDKPFVEDLIPYLTNKGLPVWYDMISIDYGKTIVTAIQEGILASGAVIFFVTRYFLDSSWCKTEMEGFLSRFGSGHDVLILCVVSHDISHDRLPLFLQMKKYLRLPPNATAAEVASELLPTIKKHFKL